jgi:hypothetical protein
VRPLPCLLWQLPPPLSNCPRLPSPSPPTNSPPSQPLPTDAFTAFHSRGTAHGLLSRYCVGTLEIGPEEKLVAKTAFEKEFRELGLTFKGEGMMDAK